MSEQELKILITKGESEQLEFKKSIAEIDAAFETVCAFLNTKGGSVLIGVHNDGRIAGQVKNETNQQKIANCVKKIQQSAKDEITITYPTIDGKAIVLIEVKQGKFPPYTYQTSAYERIQNTTSLMTYDRQRFFIANNHSGYSWENLPADSYQINHLDLELIKNIIRKGVEEERFPQEALIENTDQILKKFGLVKNNNLTNAAVILFGKNFLPDYPQCLLKLAKFKGIDRAEFIDKASIYGNIFYLLNEAMNFIRRHLPVAAKIEEGELERKEIPLIPFKALREAVLNALCHRDYSSQHGDMSLAIYDDRMEIANSGGLLYGLTVEQIKKGEVASEQRRNPVIAHVLDKCGYIERWGRGVREIIKYCKEANVADPIFFSDALGFKVTFQFVDQPLDTLVKGLTNALDSYIQTLKEKNIYMLLTLRQLEIVTTLFFKAGSKPQDILEELKEPISDRQLRRDLSVLKKYGIVSSRGKAQAVEWFIIRE